MSEEQRNQPREEPETVESARAAREEMSLREERAKGGASGGATDAETVATVGEGSPRYGATLDDIPPHGSELSWSAQPHPGYVADPGSGYTGKRIAAGTLIGCLILALGVFYTVHLLTARSSNGFGPAPWTAAVHKDGAVVGGINAQNDDVAPPVNLPPNGSFGTSGGNK
ncbi:MAG: hypothetical protein HOV87_19360 [Catenulispora sp.]|nr:hypothetical protein [Catenulispora sp.]